MRYLLGDTGKKPVESICGAKFVTEPNKFGKIIHKHVFTHYVQLSAIERAISNLQIVENIVDLEYNGQISSKDTETIGKDVPYKYDDQIKITNFISIILDAFYVEKFAIDMTSEDVTEDTIVTIYKTNVGTKELLKDLELIYRKIKSLMEQLFYLI